MSNYIPFEDRLGGGAIVRWYLSGDDRIHLSKVRSLFLGELTQFHQKARRAYVLGSIDLSRRSHVGPFMRAEYWQHYGQEYLEVYVDMDALRQIGRLESLTVAIEFVRPSDEYSVSFDYYYTAEDEDKWSTLYSLRYNGWMDVYPSTAATDVDFVLLYDWTVLKENGYAEADIPIRMQLFWGSNPGTYTSILIGPCFGRASYFCRFVELEAEVTFPNYPQFNTVQELRYWPDDQSEQEHPNWPYLQPNTFDTFITVYNSLVPAVAVAYAQTEGLVYLSGAISEAEAAAALEAVQAKVYYTTVPQQVESPYFVNNSLIGGNGLGVVDIGPRITAAHNVEYWTISSGIEMPWTLLGDTYTYFRKTTLTGWEYAPLQYRVKVLADGGKTASEIFSTTNSDEWDIYSGASWVTVSSGTITLPDNMQFGDYFRGRGPFDPLTIFGTQYNSQWVGADGVYVTFTVTQDGATVTTSAAEPSGWIRW